MSTFTTDQQPPAPPTNFDQNPDDAETMRWSLIMGARRAIREGALDDDEKIARKLEACMGEILSDIDPAG